MKTCIACCLLLSLPAGAADKQEDAARLFDELFAARIKEVAATGDAADDIALAEFMVKGVQETEMPAALRIRMCEEAFRLASHRKGGHAAAVAAMRVLAKTVPKRAAACQRAILDVQQRRYNFAHGAGKDAARQDLLATLTRAAGTEATAGNWQKAGDYYTRARSLLPRQSPEAVELNIARQEAFARARAMAELESLKKELAVAPKDAVARLRNRIVLLWLVEMDDPAAAARALHESCQETLKANVPQAVKARDTVPAATCLTLGQWYRTLAKPAKPPARAWMLVRARSYFARFMTEHTPRDVKKLTAKLAIDDITAQLKALDRTDLLATEPGGRCEPTDVSKPPAAGIEAIFDWDKAVAAVAVRKRGQARIETDGTVRIWQGAIVFDRAGKRITEACKRSNQLTIAAVITPEDLKQGGPARIVTLSATPMLRNFTLGQQGDHLILRLRTTRTDLNGMKPETSVAKLQAAKAHHVVITYLPGKLTCYLDGKRVLQSDRVQGDLSNWDPAHVLLIGDENSKGHRYWRGRIRDVMIFSRALSDRQAADLSKVRQ